MAAAHTDIALVIDDRPVGRVARLSGHEAVASPYRFDVEVHCDAPPGDAETALGRGACLDLVGAAGVSRRLHGILVEWDVSAVADGWRVRAVLGPRAWLLDQQRRTRRFHDLSAVDVALGLTAELRPDGAAYLRGVPRRRPEPTPVIAQADETDLALIARCLADAGLSYVFAQDADGERMVLVDDAVRLARAAGAPGAGLTADARDNLVRQGRLAVDSEGRPVARASWHGTTRDAGLTPGMTLDGAGDDGSGLAISALTHAAQVDGDGLHYTCWFEACPATRLVPEGRAAHAPGDADKRRRAGRGTGTFAGIRAPVNEAPVPRHMAPSDLQTASNYGYEDTDVTSKPDAAPGAPGATDGKSLNFLIPSYYTACSDEWDNAKSTYLRLGAANLSTSAGAEARYTNGERAAVAAAGGLEIGNSGTRNRLDGWFDYTGGNHVSITMGNKEEVINGKRRLQINGGGMGVWDAGPQYFLDFSEHAAGWKKTVANQASSAEFSWGDQQSIWIGAKFGLDMGFSASANLSGGLTYGLTGDVGITYGPRINFGKDSTVDLTSGSSYGLSKIKKTEAHEGILLGVLDTGDGATERAFHKKVFAALQGGTAAAGTVAGVAAAGGVAGATDEVDNNVAKGYRAGLETAQVAAAAMWAEAMAQYLIYRKRAKTREAGNYQSVLQLKDREATIASLQSGMLYGLIRAQNTGKLEMLNLDGVDAADGKFATNDPKGGVSVSGTGEVNIDSKVSSRIGSADKAYLSLEKSGKITLYSKNFNAKGRMRVNNGALSVN